MSDTSDETGPIDGGTNVVRKRAGRTKPRRILTSTLIGLTCLSLVPTTVGVWVNRTLWNTDKYVSTVVPLADNPAVIEAMATQLTDQAFVALDVQHRVEEALASLSAGTSIPEKITLLAAPITASLKGVIHDQAVTFLKSDAFQTFWLKANQELQPKIVALLEGDYSQLPNVTVGEADVQLNLLPILAQVLRNLTQGGLSSLGINVTIPDISASTKEVALQALSTALGVTLPEDFGQVTIMTSAQLHDYQDAAHLLRTLGWSLLALTVLLIVLTIAVSPTRRRTIVWLGAGGAAAIVIGAVILRRVVRTIVDQISSQEARDAARAVVTELGGSLKHAGRLVGWTAIIIAAVAYLLGRPAWLIRAVAWVRQLTLDTPGGSDAQKWVAARADALLIGGVAVAVLVLFITGIDWLQVIVVAALLALYLRGVVVAQHRASGTPVAGN